MFTELIPQLPKLAKTYDQFKAFTKETTGTEAWCFITSRYKDALGQEMWRIDCNALGAKMDATKKANEVDAEWVRDVVAEMRKTLVVLSENLQNRGDKLE